MKLALDFSFITNLPEDLEQRNFRRKVKNTAFSFVQPKVPSHPEMLHVNSEVADLLGITLTDIHSQLFLDVFSGARVYANSKPFSMAYSGHQFGQWSGQLGDGRAINLFEILHKKNRFMVQLKGAGETPYSRNGDGLAVLRSSIREYLCSEAMHNLGIPSTRVLSVCTTGDMVLRDILYNGNPNYEKGAVVCRVAPSFIRFGNFELFASQNDLVSLKKLTDYTIQFFYPHINLEGTKRYLAFYKEVVQKTMQLVLEWQRVGFVHGVLNTDNMSILGETIDYGPYGWIENYDTSWTPNTSDAAEKRYRFENQPNMVLWNVAQLGNALFPLIQDVEAMQKILRDFSVEFDINYSGIKQEKLGLSGRIDEVFHLELEELMYQSEADMTIFFRNLSAIMKKDSPELAFSKIKDSFYRTTNFPVEIEQRWLEWMATYLDKLAMERENDGERKIKMNAVNPKYIFRNYMAQLAIEAAEKGDFTLIDTFFTLLKNPYSEQVEHEKWFSKRPDWAKDKIGCSMLSCSS